MTIQELINALSQFDPTRDAVVALFKTDGTHTPAPEVLGEAVSRHRIYGPILLLPGNGHAC